MKPFARAVALFFLILPAPVLGQGPANGDPLLEMRALDDRVATIGHRLAIRSLDLCTDQAWLLGVALHHLSQYGGDYRDAANRMFGLAAGPGVLALAADGPAQRAGLRHDDIILELDGLPLPEEEPTQSASFAQLEAILDMFDRAFEDGVVAIVILRGGERLRIEVRGARGCASRFQLIPSRRLNALADGRYVQITSAIGAYVESDDELAAILAHEFAHNILRHRARLDAAGVQRGLLGNFGRNARLIRETEQEADRLAVHILERSGYDLDAALAFWERFGRRGLNFIGSPTHGSWRTRVAMIRSEVETLRRARALGQDPVPPFISPASDGSG